MARTAQSFGGAWSLLKLELLEHYLTAFNLILKDKPTPKNPFQRVYIDGFAGSGTFTFEDDLGYGFFPHDRLVHAGSAARAIAILPPFDQIILIDQKAANVAALKELGATDPRVVVERGDANEVIKRICASLGRHKRGVIFLDPFGNSVSWETLEAIRDTRALDLWYLFPLAGVFRNLPHDFRQLTPDKRATLTKILGTDEWEQEFYSPSKQHPFFGEPLPPDRNASPDKIEAFVRRRLQTVFPHVERPKRLCIPNGAPLFSLFFAVSNDSRAAITAASNVAKYLLTKR